MTSLAAVVAETVLLAVLSLLGSELAARTTACRSRRSSSRSGGGRGSQGRASQSRGSGVESRVLGDSRTGVIGLRLLPNGLIYSVSMAF